VKIALGLVLALGVVGAGCMQTTVKPTERRILTAEEAVEAEKQRKEQREKDGLPPAPKPVVNLSPEKEIEYLRTAVEKEPTNPKWHFLLGRAYENQGRLELAELRYRRGGDLIAPKDKYTGPHYFVGRVLARQGKMKEALAELQKAVAVKPFDEEAYYLNGDYRESYYLMGFIHHRLRNVSDSEECFRKFIKYGGERDRVIDFFPEMIAD
jgi:tetratricopeptide (TPR) repeat protein